MFWNKKTGLLQCRLCWASSAFTELALWSQVLVYCSAMMQMIMAKGHSRIPVYAGSVTNIVGLVLVGHLSFSSAIRNSSYSLACWIHLSKALHDVCIKLDSKSGWPPSTSWIQKHKEDAMLFCHLECKQLKLQIALRQPNLLPCKVGMWNTADASILFWQSWLTHGTLSRWRICWLFFLKMRHL
jgi:hypothetical protein